MNHKYTYIIYHHCFAKCSQELGEAMKLSRKPILPLYLMIYKVCFKSRPFYLMYK